MRQINVPGISNTSYIHITPFRDSLIIASTGGAGIVILDPQSNVKKIITTHEGLASDFIYFAAADENEFLWVGTEKGINRLRLDQQLEVVENLSFGYDNGLSGVETNQGAFFITPEHKYFGLVDGLYEYRNLGDFLYALVRSSSHRCADTVWRVLVAQLCRQPYGFLQDTLPAQPAAG